VRFILSRTLPLTKSYLRLSDHSGYKTFDNPPSVNQPKAFCVRKANSLRSILHKSKNVQNKNLYRSLRSGKNTIFISDTHLCHGYNEAVFDQTVRTISQWIKDGKSIDQVVFAGDLFHKFDPRITQYSWDQPIEREPARVVFERVKHALKKLASLKSALGKNVSLDYIYGNHELYVFVNYPALDKYFKESLNRLGIQLKTDQDDQLVDLSTKSSISHRPKFSISHQLAKIFFGPTTPIFRSNADFSFMNHDFDIQKKQVVVGAHNHLPAVIKEGKTTFVMLPAFIDLKAPNTSFPPAFTVMDTSAREPRIYFVTPNGKALGFKNINA